MAGIKGRVERVLDGQVEGWIDGAASTALELFVDDRSVAQGSASVVRGDGRSGFALMVPAALCDGKVHKIAVKAKGVPGFIQALPLITQIPPRAAPSTVAAPLPVESPPLPAPAAPEPVRPVLRKPGRGGAPIHMPAHLTGNLEGVRGEAASGWTVSGWIADKNSPDPVRISLYIDHQPVETRPADLPRRDVQAAGKSQGPSGFRFDIPKRFHDGRPHRIEIRLASDPDKALFIPRLEAFGDLPDLPPRLELRRGEGLRGYHLPPDTPLRLRLAERAMFEVTTALDGSFVCALEDLFAALYAHNNHFAVQDGVLPVAILDSEDRVLAQDRISVTVPLKFNLEHLTPSRAEGWLVHEQTKDTCAAMDVYVEGVRFATITADRDRQDVVAAGLTEQGGGFRFTPFNPFDTAAEVRVQFAPRYTRDFLPAMSDRVQMPAAPSDRLGAVHVHLAQAGGLTLLVTGTATDVCLAAIAAHTPQPYRMITTMDPVTSLAETGRDDIVILSGSALVGPGWLSGLRAAAYHDPRVATATALSSNGGATSVPEADIANLLPFDFGNEDMARLVRHAATGSYPRAPEFGSACLYIRRDALDVTTFNDPAQFAADLARLGRLHVVDDRTWVHGDAAPVTHSTPDPSLIPQRRAFREGEAMLAVRWRVRKALADQAATPARPRPRLLYVIATRTGGTPQTNRDLMAAVSDTHEPWVLTCDGKVLELYRLVDGVEERVETIALSTPVLAVTHQSADYDDAVSRLLLRYGFELVHIRHLGWHGASLPRLCRTLGLPVVFSFHDFYTLCPTVKLLDEHQVHCAGTCTATTGDCRVELWPQTDFPPLKHAFIGRWREIFAQNLSSCDAFVTTSASARDLVLRHYPHLSSKPFQVIPHGRDFANLTQAAVAPSPDAPLKILVPGNLSPAKGADLIKSILALDTERAIEWHLLGDPGRVTRAANVIVHGTYRREDFAEKVAAIAPHLGAVLSIWPETWCHTLTELWAAGVPVLGLDTGAVGERLAQHGGGWLLPVGVSAQTAFGRLLALRADVYGWRTACENVAIWQAGEGASLGTKAMASAYRAIYAALLTQEAGA